MLNQIVAAHQGNRGVGEGERAWTCQRHLKTLLFAQIAGLGSLREIVQALQADPAALYHVGLRLPARSTLSDASAARPAAVFRDVAQRLIGMAAAAWRAEGQAVIRLVDASPIPLRDPRFAWAEADARTRGLKLHVVHDPGAGQPVRFAVTSPRTSDLAVARRLPLEPGATYVFDKGYLDFRWWQAIGAAGALFVSRLKSNSQRQLLEARPPAGAAILADNLVRIGHRRPRGGAPDNPLYRTTLRQVVVARTGKAPLHLVTNDLQRPAADIAALYRQRWDIELFFKWLKQNLKVRCFLGRSENAVRIQLYVALIAHLLLRLFQAGMPQSHRHGGKALLARLKVCLWARLNLTNRAKPPPVAPHRRPPHPQLPLLFPG